MLSPSPSPSPRSPPHLHPHPHPHPHPIPIPIPTPITIPITIALLIPPSPCVNGFSGLRLKILEIFNRKVDARHERKEFAMKHGLLHVNRELKHRSKEFKQLYNDMKVFARFQNHQQHLKFVEDIYRRFYIPFKTFTVSSLHHPHPHPHPHPHHSRQ